MTRAVAELSQIPFSQLIGGPMKAAIEAQSLAAQTTIEFIQQVGFKTDASAAPTDLMFGNRDADASAGELRNVSFTYSKSDENGTVNDFTLTVPFLSIVPIPYIRIDEMTIDFSAKLTDAIERNVNSSFALDASVGGSYSTAFSPVKLDFRVSASYQKNKSMTQNQRREYNLDIHVRAMQDNMPAGLSRMLDILEQSIHEEKA